MSAIPGKVKVFQFGAAGRLNQSNYLDQSGEDSSSVPYDPELETEFSRLRGRTNLTDITAAVQIKKSQGISAKDAMQSLIRQQTLKSTTLVTEEDEAAIQVRTVKKRRSKSLDQFHVIVLSDDNINNINNVNQKQQQ